MTAPYARAAAFCSRHQSYCIASHEHPDADAIASTVALGLGLMALGKKVVLLNADQVPDGLRFLPHSDLIVSQVSDLASLEAFILVDCAQPKRAGEVVQRLAETLPPFLIDHHILSGIDVDSHCVNPQAAATAEIVYHVLTLLKVAITPDIATLLYGGLSGDTGGFRHSNTTAGVFRLAAALVELGADPWFVSSSFGEQNPPQALTLLGHVLPTLTLESHSRYAHMTLTQEMLAETQALPEHAEDFVSYPRSIAGVEVAGLFRELPDGRWKVSLRSKQSVDVAAIASFFGGGGHEHAAGCTFECNVTQAKAQILVKVAEVFARRQKRVGTPSPSN